MERDLHLPVVDEYLDMVEAAPVELGYVNDNVVPSARQHTGASVPADPVVPAPTLESKFHVEIVETYSLGHAVELEEIVITPVRDRKGIALHAAVVELGHVPAVPPEAEVQGPGTFNVLFRRGLHCDAGVEAGLIVWEPATCIIAAVEGCCLFLHGQLVTPVPVPGLR